MVDWELSPSVAAITFVGGLQALLAWGWTVGWSLVSSLASAVLLGLMTAWTHGRIEDKRLRRRNHTAHVVKETAPTVKGRLVNLDRTDLHTALRSPQRTLNAERHPPLEFVPRELEVSWRWLTQHDEAAGQLWTETQTCKQRLVEKYQEEARQIARQLATATDLSDTTGQRAPLKHDFFHGATNAEFLLLEAPFWEGRGWPADLEADGTALRLSHNEAGRGEVTRVARLAEELKSLSTSPTMADARRSLADHYARLQEAARRLAERLERLESEGQLRGKCDGCRRTPTSPART